MIDWTKLDGYLMDYRACYTEPVSDGVGTSTGNNPSVVYDDNGHPVLLAKATREQIECYMPHLLSTTITTKK